MSDAALEMKLIRDTAAGWFAKLNHNTVTTDTLRAFREWRKGDPRHDQAYLEIEAFWQRARKLERDAEIQQAAGAALERKPQGGARPGGRTIAGIALAVVAAGAGMWAWPNLVGRTYETAIGEQRFLTLADGSRIRLDTRSRVQVRLAAHERDVKLLEGRAFFEVAHDAARPFIVQADGARVRALGTRFDVRRDAQGVQVVLVEGRVRVDGPAGAHPRTWTLDPGESVTTSAVRPVEVRKVDAAQATSWTSGRLTFNDVSLADAIAEVNRYSPRPIVLHAPALASRPVSGAFDIGDTKAFVSAVADLYGLVVEDEAQQIVLAPSA